MIKKYKHKGKNYLLIQLSHTDIHGKRYQPKFRFDKEGMRITSERKARKLEFEYLTNLKDEIQGNLTSLTFKEWRIKFLSDAQLIFKKSTIMQYDGDLTKWLPLSFVSMKLTDIKKRHIHDLIFNELPKNGATVHTQKRIWKNVRRVLESAVDECLISINPAKGITVKVPPTKKLVLNTDEVELLLREALVSSHSFYYVWSFALLSGLRSGEMYGLRWRDIDEISGNINISHQWTSKDGYHSTKSNKCRVLPISKQLGGLLKELRNMGASQEIQKGFNGSSHYIDDLVLPRINDWKNGAQSKVIREFCKMIGITEIKFHDLRATFITNMLAQGVPLVQVMSIVGHSKTSTTDEYLRLAGVNIKGSTDRLGYCLPKLGHKNVISMF
jgi:integrase